MDLKVLLSPQFNVDFDDLLQETEMVLLDTPELGNFYLANVVKSDDCDKIRFTSPVLVISPQLDDFIAFCTALLGKDLGGRGVITDTDHLMLNLKCFSRIWHGLVIKNYHNEDIDEDQLIIEITINHD